MMLAKRHTAVQRSREGYVILLLLVSLIFVVAMIMALQKMAHPQRRSGSTVRLRLYCAAGIKPPVVDAIAAFHAETGIEVEVQYGGSGTLLAQLEVQPQGVDLYLAADQSYCQRAREKGLMAEILPLCQMKPVLAVAKANPKQLHSLADLRQHPGVNYGLANPDAAAVGRITKELLLEAGEWQAIQETCTVFKPTVTDLANDLKVGSLDASILWDATVAQYPELQAIPLPELDAGLQMVSVAVAAQPTDSIAALRFARYLQARDRGADAFLRHGYRPVKGDRWAMTPQLVLYAGAMTRNAIDRTVHEFCQREGVDIARIYEGCGILVSQMRAGGQPDAYLSCDQSFLDQVQDLFRDSAQLSSNAMVMVTAAGNPLQIHSLQDLARPQLRLGLAHPEKSALGALSKRLLQDAGLYEKIEQVAQVKQDLPQGDLLLTSLVAGALDAVIVYTSNATPLGDKVSIIPISTPAAIARQPYAIARSTDFPWTMRRLRQALTSNSSRHTFEQLGFQWSAPEHESRD